MKFMVVGAAVGAATHVAGSVAEVDWLPIIGFALSVFIFYAGRRDVMERAAALVAQLGVKVEALEREMSEVRRRGDLQGERVAHVETEIHHRPTHTEVFALFGRSERE